MGENLQTRMNSEHNPPGASRGGFFHSSCAEGFGGQGPPFAEGFGGQAGQGLWRTGGEMMFSILEAGNERNL
jgi:hypothetical protein